MEHLNFSFLYKFFFFSSTGPDLLAEFGKDWSLSKGLK